MPTLTHLCALCNGHQVVPDHDFGGMIPCDCTAIPASVDPYPGEWAAVNRELADRYMAEAEAGEPFGQLFADDCDGVIGPRD
jgi:hypothetical protein